MFCIYSSQQRASVGEKLFEVSGHTGTLKKMKKRLNEAINLHMDYPAAVSGKIFYLQGGGGILNEHALANISCLDMKMCILSLVKFLL